jgi:hypothetical protein
MPERASTAEGDAWVARVLGVAVPAARRGGRLLPAWMGARAELDRQIEALQQALRSENDPDYAAIAEWGFNGLTGGRNTKLMAALTDCDADPSPANIGRVHLRLDEYATLLAPGTVLDDYDANPLGVRVSLRATLARGLDAVRQALPADGKNA